MPKHVRGDVMGERLLEGTRVPLAGAGLGVVAAHERPGEGA